MVGMEIDEGSRCRVGGFGNDGWVRVCGDGREDGKAV
jgi:hypothetical protein